jgi:hypothetical protein
MDGLGRSFLSFNTPEHCRWCRMWDEVFGRKHAEYYNPLPSFYERRKIDILLNHTFRVGEPAIQVRKGDF